MSLRMEILACRVLLGLLLALASGSASAAEKSLNDLTGPWQLLVDDHCVADKDDVVRVYHPFEKHPKNPVLKREKPWEGLVYLYGTVLPTEDRTGLRMWYQSMIGPPEVSTVLYAESKDGIHWDKPELGIRQRQGSTANNMFFPRPHGNGIASVIHTPWDPDPAKRYKIMNYDKGGFWGAYSPDGIHLTDLPNNPVFRKGGDVAQFLWDFKRGEYVGHVKNIEHVSGLRRRSVARIASDRIDEWPNPELVLCPDSYDDRWASGIQRTHFYGLSAFNYESMYIGFLWVFRATECEGYFDGPVFMEIVTSHDGIHWFREQDERPAMLPVGGPGQWDAGQLYTATQPILKDGKLWLYYGACEKEHGNERFFGLEGMPCAIGLATLRKDGFASLDARSKVGSVTTKRLAGADGSLRVNFKAGRGGWVKVEVLDPDGYALEGYRVADRAPLTGDELNQTVAWSEHKTLPALRGPVRLRFVLQNASLYSFAAGPDLEVLEEPAPIPLGVLANFEGGGGQYAPDALKADGVQKITFNGMFKVDRDAEHAAFGKRCLDLTRNFSPLMTLELDGTRELGRHFTLAVMAKSQKNQPARLFSSASDQGPIRSTELVFDCDPRGKALNGLRLICKGIIRESNPLVFDDGQYHHLAVTYDDGKIAFYLDGENVGQCSIPGGDGIAMERNLFVAEDAAHGRCEQFHGYLDDVLVLGRSLSPEEIKTLASQGADALKNLQGR